MVRVRRDHATALTLQALLFDTAVVTAAHGKALRALRILQRGTAAPYVRHIRRLNKRFTKNNILAVSVTRQGKHGCQKEWAAAADFCITLSGMGEKGRKPSEKGRY